jgi:hypothetical protein
MHAIPPRLFSKDVYSVPLRALRLRGCVRLGRGEWEGGYLPKCFQMYKHFWGLIIIFPKIQLFSKFTFSCPENYLNSPENLLQIYLIYLQVRWKSTWNSSWAIIRGVAPPLPPVSFKQTLSDLLFMYFTSQNIVHHTLEHFAVVILQRGSNLWIFII